MDPFDFFTNQYFVLSYFYFMPTSTKHVWTISDFDMHVYLMCNVYIHMHKYTYLFRVPEFYISSICCDIVYLSHHINLSCPVTCSLAIHKLATIMWLDPYTTDLNMKALNILTLDWVVLLFSQYLDLS